MQIKIIATTIKGEEALRKYVDSSKKIEEDMSKLSRANPKRIKFNFEQKQAKKFIIEEYFEKPSFMIVATVNDKYKNRALMFIESIENEFHKIMLNSNCGKNDYYIEVI